MTEKEMEPNEGSNNQDLGEIIPESSQVDVHRIGSAEVGAVDAGSRKKIENLFGAEGDSKSSSDEKIAGYITYQKEKDTSSAPDKDFSEADEEAEPAESHNEEKQSDDKAPPKEDTEDEENSENENDPMLNVQASQGVAFKEIAKYSTGSALSAAAGVASSTVIMSPVLPWIKQTMQLGVLSGGHLVVSAVPIIANAATSGALRLAGYKGDRRWIQIAATAGATAGAIYFTGGAAIAAPLVAGVGTSLWTFFKGKKKTS